MLVDMDIYKIKYSENSNKYFNYQLLTINY